MYNGDEEAHAIMKRKCPIGHAGVYLFVGNFSNNPLFVLRLFDILRANFGKTTCILVI